MSDTSNQKPAPISAAAALILSPSRSSSIHTISSPLQQPPASQPGVTPLSPMSQHQAKKEAHHNRRAIHRRTQSQFDFKNCATPNIGAAVTSNKQQVPSFVQHSPSQSACSALEPYASYNQPTLSQYNPINASQQVPVQLEQSSSPTSRQDSLFNFAYPSQIASLTSTQSSTHATTGFPGTSTSPEVQNSAQSSLSSTNNTNAMTTIQMIQLMQVRQTQDKQMHEKEQIIETIEDDLLKFSASNSSNSNYGFNFGKKKSKLYSKLSSESTPQEGTTPTSSLLQANKQSKANEQQQQQQQQQQQSPAKFTSTTNPIASFFFPETSDQQPNNFNSSNTNTGNHNHLHNYLFSSVLQPIPEQDVSSLGEFSMFSQPGSTRNANNTNNNGNTNSNAATTTTILAQPEEKKSTFHSHSSSMSNPVTMSPQISGSTGSPPRGHSHIGGHKRRVSASKFSGGSSSSGSWCTREDEIILSNTLNPFTQNQTVTASTLASQPAANATEDRECRISSARDHYKSPSQVAQNNTSAAIVTGTIDHQVTFEQQQLQQQQQQLTANQTIANTTSPKPNPPVLPSNTSSAPPQSASLSEKKFFSSIKKQQQFPTPQVHSAISTPAAGTGTQQQGQSLHLQHSDSAKAVTVSKHKKQSSLAEEMDLNLKTIQAHLQQLSKLDKSMQVQSSIKSQSNPKLRNDSNSISSNSQVNSSAAPSNFDKPHQQFLSHQTSSPVSQTPYQQLIVNNNGSGVSTSSLHSQFHLQPKPLSRSQAVTLSQELPSAAGLGALNSDRNPSNLSISNHTSLKQQLLQPMQQSSVTPLSSSSTSSLLDSKRHRPLQDSKTKQRTVPGGIITSNVQLQQSQQNTQIKTSRTFQQVQQQLLSAQKLVSGQSNSSSQPSLHQRKSSATTVSSTASQSSQVNQMSSTVSANTASTLAPQLAFSQSAVNFQYSKNNQQFQPQEQSIIKVLPKQQQPSQQQHLQQQQSQQQQQPQNSIQSVLQPPSTGESKKITELESMVTELRTRMHHLEETNSFLLNNIRSLLDEKQSDKKHIKDIESQTQQNNMHIAAIRQIITSKSSGTVSVKGIDSSTHIFTDASSSNESQGPDAHFVLNQTSNQTSHKDNSNNNVLIGSFLQSSPLNNVENSFIMRQHSQPSETVIGGSSNSSSQTPIGLFFEGAMNQSTSSQSSNNSSGLYQHLKSNKLTAQQIVQGFRGGESSYVPTISTIMPNGGHSQQQSLLQKSKSQPSQVGTSSARHIRRE